MTVTFSPWSVHDMFLEAAVDGGAARLAGDADLLEIGSIRNVLIVTPTAVVDELDR